jgi:hypothetical protein
MRPAVNPEAVIPNRARNKRRIKCEAPWLSAEAPISRIAKRHDDKNVPAMLPAVNPYAGTPNRQHFSQEKRTIKRRCGSQKQSAPDRPERSRLASFAND